MEASAGSSILNDDEDVGSSRKWINCDAAISAAHDEEVLGMSKW